MNKKVDFKNPWESHPDIWKTKSAFFVWLRGSLRRAVWEKYPPKLQLKNELCSPPPKGYSGRAKSGAGCALTGEWTAKSYLEVDHIKGNASLRDWDDVLGFIQHLCPDKSNLQLVSKEAHKIKSYAEKQGITFDEAVIEKKIIKIVNDKLDKTFFTDRKLKVPSNVTLRKTEIRKILKSELPIVFLDTVEESED